MVKQNKKHPIYLHIICIWVYVHIGNNNSTNIMHAYPYNLNTTRVQHIDAHVRDFSLFLSRTHMTQTNHIPIIPHVSDNFPSIFNKFTGHVDRCI